jgi:hypothetical protein
VRGSSAQAFFLPRRFSTRIVLDEPYPLDLREYRFESINPSTYVLDNQSLAWRGGTNFQPSFVARSFSDDEQRADAAFYAGLAFGIAAAVLIALIQALPGVVDWARQARGT